MKRILRKDLTSVSRSDIVVFVRDNNNNYRQGQRMTRKDYQLIAQVLSVGIRTETLANNLGGGYTTGVAYCLAKKLQEDNPRFNEEIFLKACGL